MPLRRRRRQLVQLRFSELAVATHWNLPLIWRGVVQLRRVRQDAAGSNLRWRSSDARADAPAVSFTDNTSADHAVADAVADTVSDALADTVALALADHSVTDHTLADHSRADTVSDALAVSISDARAVSISDAFSVAVADTLTDDQANLRA